MNYGKLEGMYILYDNSTKAGLWSTYCGVTHLESRWIFQFSLDRNGLFIPKQFSKLCFYFLNYLLVYGYVILRVLFRNGLIVCCLEPDDQCHGSTLRGSRILKEIHFISQNSLGCNIHLPWLNCVSTLIDFNKLFIRRYRSYPPDVLIDLVARILALVPPWTRIYRVQRDIPMPLVSSGVEHGNLRELALARMKDLGTKCRDVRTREVHYCSFLLQK